MSLNILTNFETQKHYENQPKFNGVYSRNNSAKVKNGTYVINLDECKSIRTLWIAWYVNGNNGSASYDGITLTTSELNTVQKRLKNSWETKILKIYRMQGYDSIMCEYFCIEFIHFMVKGKSLLDYTNLFYPNEYEMNEQIILKYSQ